MIVTPPKNFLLKNIIDNEDIYKNYDIEIDDCLVEEIKYLWKKGIRTTGCCCGHKGKYQAYIGVLDGDIPKMLELGYKMSINEFGSIEFEPKTKCNCKLKELKGK